jgi:periplasmic copper chaperone A
VAYLLRRAVLYGLAAALVLVSATLSTTSGRASDYRIGPMVVAQPWARATPKGASTGAAYMTITNTGSAPDRVSCVSSDASAECQIHIMAIENGVMKMRRIEDSLEIRPNETAVFKPSGMHLMLVHLKHPLDQGKTAKITLKFDNAGSLEVGYPIEAIGAVGPDGSTGGNGVMKHEHGSTMQMDKH